MKAGYLFLLSRVPFLSVMILPYFLGALLAARSLRIFKWPVFFLGLSGAVLVQLIAHYSGEVYDLKEDRLSAGLEKNSFSGGSQVVVKNLVLPGQVKNLLHAAVLLALTCGLILQFYLKTGIWTLTLGFSGIACAYFYSRPPLRLVSRGIGEALIAYAFGWLSVNSGFYLQTSYFSNLPFLVSLPVALSVVNIILINEFPDYPADCLAVKRNLLVRAGKKKGAGFYFLFALLTPAAFLAALAGGLPLVSVVFYLPVMVFSMFLSARILKGGYNNRGELERLCAGTILVNLGTTLSCILGVFLVK